MTSACGKAGLAALACGILVVAVALYYGAVLVAVDAATFADLEAYGEHPDSTMGLTVAFLTAAAGCLVAIAAAKQSDRLPIWIAAAIALSALLMMFIAPGPLAPTWIPPEGAVALFGDQFTLKDYIVAWAPGAASVVIGLGALSLNLREKTNDGLS